MNRKHFWIMLACCLVPVAAILAVWAFDIPLGTLGTYALFLLCPLGHLLLMRGIGHKKRHQETAKSDSLTIEDVRK